MVEGLNFTIDINSFNKTTSDIVKLKVTFNH